MSFFKFNKTYFLISLTLLAVEILIAMFMTDSVIRSYGGDFLVVIFLYCLVKSFVSLDAVYIAALVLVFAFLIEALQYFQLVKLLGLEQSTLARVVLGTSFEWGDMAAYTLGVVGILIIEWKRTKLI